MIRRVFHLGVLLDYFAFLIAWSLWHFNTLENPLVPMLLLLPIVAPLPGLITGNRNAFKWTGLLLMPYLVYILMEAMVAPAARFWTVINAAVAILLLVSLMFYLRFTSIPAHPERTGQKEP